MPCQFGISVIDFEPYLNITEKGLDLELALGVNIECKKKIEEPYHQLFKLNTDKMVMKMIFNTTDPDVPDKPYKPDKKIHFFIDEWELSFKNVSNSTIGEIPASKLNGVVSLLKGMVLKPLNVLGTDGILFSSLIEMFGIDWLNLDDTVLEPRKGYFYIKTNPVFIHEKLAKYIAKFIESRINMMF